MRCSTCCNPRTNAVVPLRRGRRICISLTPAPSADAPGGARALAASTDAVASDILAWLATVDTRKR